MTEYGAALTSVTSEESTPSTSYQRLHTKSHSHVVTIDGSWLIVLLVLFAISAVSALAACIVIANLQQGLNNCPLYASLHFKDNEKKGVTLDSANTSWEEGKNTCAYAQWTMTSAAICLFIMAWFFITWCSQTNGQRKLWRFIPPSFVLTFTFSILMLFAAILISDGYSEMCTQIARINSNVSCSTIQNLWEENPPGIKLKTTQQFIDFITAAQISAWLATSFCWLATIWLLKQWCSVVCSFFKRIKKMPAKHDPDDD